MKRLVLIGGGDMKVKSTLKIDEYVANLAKQHAGENRAYGLYIGTASHDFMPAFNTFRKTYTSVFDIKADVALTVYVQTEKEKLIEKFNKADFIYIGGGDTLFMIEHFKKSGLLELILNAYERGVTIVGRSAGAICWFTDMYTDTNIVRGIGNDYSLEKGLGTLKGLCCPHFNLRKEDFTKAFLSSEFESAYLIEDDSALVFENGELTKCVTSGKKAYMGYKQNGELVLNEIPSEN